MNTVIDLTAYLPAPAWTEEKDNPSRRTVRQVVDGAVGVIEGLVTLGIGLCFTAGVILFIGLML